MTTGKLILPILPILAFTGIARTPALASLMTIPPFSGAFNETWESFPASHGEPIQYLPDPTMILGGSASISHPEMVVFDSSAPVGLGSSGPAQPSDGTKAISVRGLSATATIVFGTPMVSFGACWGADTAPFDPNIGDPALITVKFYDVSDGLIATEVFAYSRTQYNDGLLEWHGWFSTTPFARVTFTEDLTVVDGLQADPIPEPATAALLGFGALAFIRRHKRRPH